MCQVLCHIQQKRPRSRRLHCGVMSLLIEGSEGAQTTEEGPQTRQARAASQQFREQAGGVFGVDPRGISL